MKTQFKDLLKKNSTRKAFIGAASFLVIVVGGGGAAYAYYQTPVAYLSLDINPSVELGVNAFDKVVTAEGYNEDGQTILAGLDVTGTTVDKAVQSLITSADEKGYIANDGSTVISLTSETNDSEKAAELQTTSEAGAKEALEELDKEAVVQKDNVAIERRDEAKELGITPGKLNLINKLQEVDPDATIEDYKDASVKEIMKTIKENKKEEKSDDLDSEEETKAQTVDRKELNSEESTEDATEEDSVEKETKKNDSNKSQTAIDKQAANVKDYEESTTAAETKEDLEDTTKATTNSTEIKSDEDGTKSKIKENNSSETKKDNDSAHSSKSIKNN